MMKIFSVLVLVCMLICGPILVRMRMRIHCRSSYSSPHLPFHIPWPLVVSEKIFIIVFSFLLISAIVTVIISWVPFSYSSFLLIFWMYKFTFFICSCTVIIKLYFVTYFWVFLFAGSPVVEFTILHYVFTLIFVF